MRYDTMSRTASAFALLLSLTAPTLVRGQSSAPVSVFNFSSSSNNCTTCHASPPNIAASSPAGSLTLGLLDDGTLGTGNNSGTWLQNPLINTVLKDRINGIASEMTAVAGNSTKLAELYNYLIALRDGSHSIASGSTLDFGQQEISSSTTRSFAFTLYNYRNTPFNYTVSVSGSKFSVSSHTTNGSGCSPGNIPAASNPDLSSSCTVTVGVRYSATSTEGTDTGTLTVSTSGNSPAPAIQPNTVALHAVAYRPTPVLSLSTTAASPLNQFAATVNKESETRFVTVTNNTTTSTGTLASTFSVSGNGFSLNGGTCDSTLSLTPGTSCMVGIKFTPTRAGTSSAPSLNYTGSLTFTHNAAGSPSTLNLAGTGTQSIATIPTLLEFGDVKKDAVKDLTLTISNGSNTATALLNFTPPPLIQGTAAGDYTIITNNCTAVSAVSPNNTCTITVRFRPTTSDGSARPATLTLQTDAANLIGGTATIALTGTGTAQSAPTLSAQALTFADTVLGETSPPASFTITNPRTDTLTYALTLPAEFVEDTPACINRSIPASGTCTISLRMRPLAASGAGPRSASVPVSFTVPAGQTAPASLPLTVAGTALWPLSASPTALSPSTTIGATALPVTTLSNHSRSPITLGSFTFGGTTSSDYAVDTTSGCRTGVILPAGQGCTLVLRYTPTQPSSPTQTLSIVHNAVAGSPLVLTLNGSVQIGQMSLSASSMAFADTTLGSPPSPASLITLRNTGSAPLTLSSLTLGGSHPGDFSRSGTCQASGMLAIGAECTVSLQFQPSALGNRAATLSIAHTGSAPSPVVLTLSGQGLAQPVGLLLIDSDNPLDFGSQTLNGLYNPRPVRLRNTGTANLQITGLTLGGSGFSLVDNPACTVGTTLAIGQSCDLGVRFSPPLADTDYHATLTIAHSAGAPQAVTFVGRGTAAVVPVLTWVDAPAALDFGQQTVGTASTTTRTLSLRNQGPGAVILSLVNAIGLDAAMFPVQGGSGDSGACSAGLQLAQGLSCTVTLRFSPGSPGAHAARLQVLSSGTALAPLPLVGTGLGPATDTPLTLSTSHLGFGATRTGSASLPMEVLLQAGSLAAVQVVGWAVEGPFLVENRDCPPLPFTLAAGSQCAVVVRFLPGVAGEATGTLQVTSSETSSTDGSGTSSPSPASVRRVALSGQGQASADVVDGGGGCSMARPGDHGRIDPVLPLLAIVALWVLWWRRRSACHGR